MTEEIQEIERLTKQSGELADSLLRLARKLQEPSRRQTNTHEERPEHLAALHKILTDLRSNIDVVKREIVTWGHYNRDEDYAKARTAVVDGTATPQEAVVQLLQVCVADKTMSPDVAVESSLSYSVRIYRYPEESRSAKPPRLLLRPATMF